MNESARNTKPETVDAESGLPRRRRWPVTICLILLIGFAVFQIIGTLQTMDWQWSERQLPQTRHLTYPRANYSQRPDATQTQGVTKAPGIDVWWDDVPKYLHRQSDQSDDDGKVSSNIHPGDYAGPESCQKCHQENYVSWSDHAHRRMNALADASNVVGDFSGTSISYLGGEATFYQENGEYRMRLEREETQTYAIHETIGSRFFQYYIGKQIDGDQAAGQSTDQQRLNHVLPLGFWIEPGEWVPIVNVTHEEGPDGTRLDPFDSTSYQNNFAHYAVSCDICHVTRPLGDQLSGKTLQLAREVTGNMRWEVANYLAEERPHHLPPGHRALTDQQVTSTIGELYRSFEAEPAVIRGISCESCHLGCREHVENPKLLPAFFPKSPHLHAVSADGPVDYGRTHENMNWACGRCHSGNRPQYAAGMATWNSTEYSDAMRGSCYSQLNCVNCHNPHEGIGHQWSSTPAHDDASCIKCHEQYASEESQAAHSHHQPGSEGSRCMNCHMPRINEGMQDMVRTHTIFSPTNTEMIHANQSNACNQCHTDKSIDWTVDYLEKWFDSKYDDTKLQTQYANRKESAALGWLQGENEAVRKVALDSLFRTKSRWEHDTTIQETLINALDDPYLINRQFASRKFEDMLGVPLKDYGYRFYMTAEEREQPMAKLRKVLRAAFAETPVQNED